MGRTTSTSVKKEERLFSLILALIASREGLTKGEILRTVRGYSEQYDFKANPTLDKLFDRDKATLRDLGVVIDTIELPGEEGQTHNVRYSVSRRTYDFPDDVTFSQQEMALLQLAATAWREASLSSDSVHALTKLKSLGIVANEPLLGVAPRIRTQERSFSRIEAALDDEAIISFMYLKPGQVKAQLRTVAPLGLTNWRGRWYLLAHDFDAGAERTFLLSRVVSDPKKQGQERHDRPVEDYSARLEAELNDLASKNSAVVVVSPDSDAQVQLAGRTGSSVELTEFTLSYADADLLADELIFFGPDIVSVQPADIAQRVSSRISRIADLHAGGVL